MTHQHCPVSAVAMPAACSIAKCYAATDLADAYAIGLPAEASTDPEQLARFVLLDQAPWVAVLMRLRDAIVGRLGLKTAQQLQGPADVAQPDRIGIFRIYDRRRQEIVLGEDDAHLDFRLSLLIDPAGAHNGNTAQLVVSTVVHCHNRLGRSYIALIAPFHRAVVRSALSRAARRGWPAARAPASPMAAALSLPL